MNGKTNRRPEGQMFPAEREFLHLAVLDARPKLILEIGTWKGGGSTLQIANALAKLRRGKLYTCEPDQNCFNTAKEFYKDNEQVTCFHDKSTGLINQLIFTKEIPDFVFFDGAEDAYITYNDFILLDQHLKKGSHFIAHDWDVDKSQKCSLLRPFLEQCNKWSIVAKLTHPDSVGIVHAVKV